jgi:hypothetical protein
MGKEVHMKKHEFVRFVIVLALVAVWGMVPTVYGQEKVKPEAAAKEVTGFTIARAVIGTGVENSEPVGVAETFPASTEKVYCFLEAKDIGQDAEVSFVWFHGQKEMLKTSLPLKQGPRWRTNASKNLRGLTGDWKVEIKDASGNLLKEVTFKVE